MFPVRRLGLSFLKSNRFLSTTSRLLSAPATTKSTKLSAPQKGDSAKNLDKTILSSLSREIKEEQGCPQEVVPPRGWKYELTGNEVRLTRQVETETVEVTFNALNTEKFPYTTVEELEESKNAPQFLCVPELSVVISRQDKGKLVFCLNYVEDEDPDEVPFNEEDDADDEPYDEESQEHRPRKYDDEHELSFKVKSNLWVDVESVSFLDQNGKLVYRFVNDMFDYEFGCNMVEFLNTRGVNVEFFNSIMDLATQVDSKLYLNFLNGLHNYYSS